MKYCLKCGVKLSENDKFCPNCGVETANNTGYVNSGNNNNSFTDGDAPNFGFAVLGFIIPLVGLILYLIWNNEYPLRAKSCGKGALYGVIASFVVFICSIVGILGLMRIIPGGFYY
jgi:hypothetical protein